MRVRRLPVVDGTVNGDIYGHASTLNGAALVARASFVDPIDHVYLETEPFRLRDGRVVEAAYVVVTIYGAGKA